MGSDVAAYNAIYELVKKLRDQYVLSDEKLAELLRDIANDLSR